MLHIYHTIHYIKLKELFASLKFLYKLAATPAEPSGFSVAWVVVSGEKGVLSELASACEEAKFSLVLAVAESATGAAETICSGLKDAAFV